MAAVLEVSAADPNATWSICRRLRQPRNGFSGPIFVVVGAQFLHLLDPSRHDLFDDFVIDGFNPTELAIRILHRLPSPLDQAQSRPELISHGPILINTDTYQATVDGRLLDLTYMEYELLRYLASSPGQVFSREVLLNQVWGYEYYGGARTVDVHIRRLRAKLGEEHAHLIVTVRSVGYRLGQAPI